MATKATTFPKLNKNDRELFDLHLASMVRVERPELVSLMLGGLNDSPIVDVPGKIGNAAWRNLHADEAIVYSDESSRSRQDGGSQVETVRAYVKRIAQAYADAFGKEFPLDAFKLTAGDDSGTVDIWRIR